MPKARKAQISLQDTPYYHCVSRCVRRAFLCGEDRFSGKSHEHRRQWVEDRIHFLSDIFAIEVCAYAVMSNHTHLVLHVNLKRAEEWTLSEVIERWHRLHHGTHLSRQYENPQLRASLSEIELGAVFDTAEVWRQRLKDISWFMRSLNEYIAREANKEDGCTGHFWEGRFKSQALLDEAALAACMAYVDLNPVRAKMAPTPEKSNHTSIQYRINAAKVGKEPKRLMPFVGNPRLDMPHGLPFRLSDYLELVDITGKRVVRGKKGQIDNSLPEILTRLNINSVQWIELAPTFEDAFHHAAGNVIYLEKYKQRHQLQRIWGTSSAKRLLD